MIPKIIHQVWIGDQSKRPTKLLNSIKDMNPGWEYKLWTEDNLPELELQPLMDAIPNSYAPAVCDLIRVELLYRYGGFYVDADSLALEPFPDTLLENDSFTVWESEYLPFTWMANGYLAATKGNRLMRALMDHFISLGVEQLRNADLYRISCITGPGALTDKVKELQYTDIQIYPSHYFIPEHYTGLGSHGRKPSYTKQLYASTQMSEFNY